MNTTPRSPSFWRSRPGIVLCGFLIVAGFFLITEHTAHVLGALPWLLLAACPLMHLFMHHGYRHSEHEAGAHQHAEQGHQSASGERQ